MQDMRLCLRSTSIISDDSVITLTQGKAQPGPRIALGCAPWWSAWGAPTV